MSEGFFTGLICGFVAVAFYKFVLSGTNARTQGKLYVMPTPAGA